MTQLERLVAELDAAQTAYDEAREARFLQNAWRDGSAQVAVAQQSARIAAQELQRCKDNLCAFILESRGKVQVSDLKLWSVSDLFDNEWVVLADNKETALKLAKEDRGDCRRDFEYQVNEYTLIDPGVLLRKTECL